MSHVESKGASSQQFNKIVKDFKRALGERKTPKDIIHLNYLIIFIILVSLALTFVDYSLSKHLISDLEHGSKHVLQCLLRYLYIVQLGTNVRTLVDIANEKEVNIYRENVLSKIDRFTYINNLIQQQGDSL